MDMANSVSLVENHVNSNSELITTPSELPIFEKTASNKKSKTKSFQIPSNTKSSDIL